MRRARNIFLLVALASLVAVASASARSTGAANQVVLGSEMLPMAPMNGQNVGTATFTLTSTAKTPLYDLTVGIGSCAPAAPTDPWFPVPGLQLAAKPAHINAAAGSFTPSDPFGYSYRWHINKLMPGKTQPLTVSFVVPDITVTGGPIYDPYGNVTGYYPTYTYPYLCVEASVMSESDHSNGAQSTVQWSNFPK